jgi:hypothetical protein
VGSLTRFNSLIIQSPLLCSFARVELRSIVLLTGCKYLAVFQSRDHRSH